MSGYPQQQPPAPKPGMSTGKKIALGCGIPAALGLLVLGGCTLVVGKAAEEVGKELDKSYDSAQVNPSDGTSADGKNGRPDITKDVKVTSCAVKTGEFDMKELEVKVDYTNSGDRRYSYLAEGEVLVNGEKKEDLLSTAQNLAPGQKYTDDNAGALGFNVAKAAKPGDKIECKILKVSRNAL
ncbi:hypothetical protein WKI68_40720 [Streptomyces sp. MS1.HAVA.3]|uniref:DUF4352 domain-containing protein n=1 Tax=Streptomyces caledonius TaxID=3134107 RepID=A0ABU8UD61_9ACTN